jgi:hypothetical protein
MLPIKLKPNLKKKRNHRKMKDIKRNHMILIDLIIDKVEIEMADTEKLVIEMVDIGKVATEMVDTEMEVTEKVVTKITRQAREITDLNIKRSKIKMIIEVIHLLRIVLRKTRKEPLTTDRSTNSRTMDLLLFKENQKLRILTNHKSILESNMATRTEDLMLIDS